jgi:hypothetical protein
MLEVMVHLPIAWQAEQDAVGLLDQGVAAAGLYKAILQTLGTITESRSSWKSVQEHRVFILVIIYLAGSSRTHLNNASA